MADSKTTSADSLQGTYPAPGPDPMPDWSQDDPAHPGFVVARVDDTPGNKAYYIHLEAKPGKANLRKEFLQDVQRGIDQEPLTGPWFALQYSATTFGIFEAFPDALARHAHDGWPGGQNFSLRPDALKEMLAYPARLHRLDILHGKPDVMLGKPIEPA